MDLPPEIRLEIYKYILPYKQTLFFLPLILTFKWKKPKGANTTCAILIASRAIRQEAAPILYGQNTLGMYFRSAHLVHTHTNFLTVGELNCSLIRNLEFLVPFTRYLETVMRLLELAKRVCRNLRQVDIKVLKPDAPPGTTLSLSPSQPVGPSIPGQEDRLLKELLGECQLSIEIWPCYSSWKAR